MISYIDDQYASSQKSIIMSSESESEQLRAAVFRLGEELGKRLVELYFLEPTEIRTPMKACVRRSLPKIPLCSIITTRDDFEYLGKGMARVLDNSIMGYMDFEGQRGIQALNAQITHMELPEPIGQHVDTLVIGKAVLATGCTAIHLAKTVFGKYLPRRVVISSLFYSEQGVADLMHEIPNADLILVGEPDTIDDNGMLVPGVGNLDKRLAG
ncbi:uracil phosphoribosyltransferase [Pseudomonas sp.]|uniref:uracil phosphoribosyltransferase n=1 Tax=Pseudomonas sp. TaxID=306 RepID=UPI0032429899